MFKRRKWPHPNRVDSDEGFSVETFGRDTLVYSESGRRMTVTIERDGTGITVFADTVARWDNDLMQSIDANTKRRIIDNIQRALESQGESVAIL